LINRSVRNLSYLERSASTARVLNLHATERRSRHDPDHGARPLFQHSLLNKGIYLKHRVRPNEQELFEDGRSVAIKILLPIDPKDLRLGGRYVFLGERSFDRVVEGVFGASLGADKRDRKLLELLDSIPSLDPFLLREHLRRHGIEASPCYFDLSEADTKAIFRFVEEQLQPLIGLSLKGDIGFNGEGERLVKKMLAGDTGAELEPLRLVLRLQHNQFAEGVFCWKGFLYYKWALREVLEKIPLILKQIATVHPQGPQTPAVRTYIEQARETVRGGVLDACEAVRRILNVYDEAFRGLIERGEPQAFRDFLLAAPERFIELGDRLGAINHLVSFWSFRFPHGARPAISGEELSDLFLDFEQGLSFTNRGMSLAW
jgi:hypothetical protein